MNNQNSNNLGAPATPVCDCHNCGPVCRLAMPLIDKQLTPKPGETIYADQSAHKDYCERCCQVHVAIDCPAPFPKPFDDIQKAVHYNTGKVECIDAIEAALTPEEYRGFLKGNILKYTWRERQKEGDKAMGKALYYLERLLGRA